MPVNVLDSLPAGDFDSYRIPRNLEDGALQGRLLLAVDASGRLEDHFRIVFGGGQQPSTNFAGSKISDHPALNPFRFSLDVNPENIEIKKNSFSSKWEDLEAMVAADKILISSEESALRRRQMQAQGFVKPGKRLRSLLNLPQPPSAGQHKPTRRTGSNSPCRLCQALPKLSGRTQSWQRTPLEQSRLLPGPRSAPWPEKEEALVQFP